MALKVHPAHLDSEKKINAVCLPQSEEQMNLTPAFHEGEKCRVNYKIVQLETVFEKAPLHNCNVGIFHLRWPQFRSSLMSLAGSFTYAHHRSMGPEGHCSKKTLISVLEEVVHVSCTDQRNSKAISTESAFCTEDADSLIKSGLCTPSTSTLSSDSPSPFSYPHILH